MHISEIKDRLKENGIDLPIYTIRRRMNSYLSHTSRNHKNNFRDITQEEFKTLLLALAMENKGKLKEQIEMLLNGQMAKTELLADIIDCTKVDEILKRWIEE